MAVEQPTERLAAMLTQQAREAELMRAMNNRVQELYIASLGGMVLVDPGDVEFQKQSLTQSLAHYFETEKQAASLVASSPGNHSLKLKAQ